MRTRGEHIQLGIRGEDVACRELERRGYAILARRFRTRNGEIDIIARDGETLVFVEVKARRSLRCGGPAEAVNWAKRQRLERMALRYLAAAGAGAAGRRCRFDVVSVLYAPGAAAPSVDVIRNAFDVP
jgi:putative endonuclease